MKILGARRKSNQSWLINVSRPCCTSRWGRFTYNKKKNRKKKQKKNKKTRALFYHQKIASFYHFFMIVFRLIELFLHSTHFILYANTRGLCWCRSELYIAVIFLALISRDYDHARHFSSPFTMNAAP